MIKKFIDNFGSTFWFGMDIAWMLGFTNIAVFLILPTFLSGLLMFWQHKRNMSEILVDAATLSWMLMNIAWMVSDMCPFFHDTLNIVKLFFAILGLICVITLAIIDFRHLNLFKRFKN